MHYFVFYTITCIIVQINYKIHNYSTNYTQITLFCTRFDNKTIDFVLESTKTQRNTIYCYKI